MRRECDRTCLRAEVDGIFLFTRMVSVSFRPKPTGKRPYEFCCLLLSWHKECYFLAEDDNRMEGLAMPRTQRGRRTGSPGKEYGFYWRSLTGVGGGEEGGGRKYTVGGICGRHTGEKGEKCVEKIKF